MAREEALFSLKCWKRWLWIKFLCCKIPAKVVGRGLVWYV